MDKMTMLRLIGFGTVGFAAVNLFSVTFNMIEDGLLSVISDFWCNLVKSVFMLVILWACRPIKGQNVLSARDIGIQRKRKRSMLGDEVVNNAMINKEDSSSSSED